MDAWQIILGVMMGVGLSAACGFRVFIPPLVLAIGHQAHVVELGDEFAWMGSTVALIIFAVAAVVEICAYYIPWLDNALDAVAAPLAVGVGTIMSASMLSGADPVLQWSIAAVAGGGAAGAVQLATTVARGASTLVTGGTGNWVVSTSEGVGAVGVSSLAIVGVVATILVFITFLVFVGYLIYRNPANLWREWRTRNAPARPLKEPPVLSST